MNLHGAWPTVVWGARDLMRRPLDAALLFTALAALTTLVAVSGLLPRALSWTWRDLIDATPALVIRRVEAGGWTPLPVGPALEAARRVPGLIDPRPRVWGTAAGPDRPLTVVAADSAGPGGAPPAPLPGEAQAGPAVNPPPPGQELILRARETMAFRVTAGLPSEAAMAVHDVVRLHPADARRLLGIPPGHASDLCADVFHEAEAEALLPELAAAFPWPVRIRTRQAEKEAVHGRMLRLGGMAALAAVPALLAMALVVTAEVRGRRGNAREAGLLKALGWTGRDLVRFQMARALTVGLPAVAAGAALTVLLVFSNASHRLVALMPGWPAGGPPLHLGLDPAGTAAALLESALIVLAPYLAAVVWAAVTGAAADPAGLIDDAEGDG